MLILYIVNPKNLLLITPNRGAFMPTGSTLVDSVKNGWKLFEKTIYVCPEPVLMFFHW